MDRRRSVILAGAVLGAALAIGQVMQTGAAESSVTMYSTGAPPQETRPAPLRIAAATPIAGYAAASPVLPVRLEPAPKQPQADPAPPPAVAESDFCAPMLDVFADDAANLSVTLTAPCQPNRTVVLQHGGLAVTFQTTATGALFVSLPGMDMKGDLSVRFPDGSQVSAQAPMPELANLHRVAVQWMAADRFALRSDSPAVLIGTASGPLPMQAEVVTLPDTAAPFLSIEAEVTAATCGRELLGEVLTSDGGVVTRADLSLAMPECDGKGGFVALNNPLVETKLAQAD